MILMGMDICEGRVCWRKGKALGERNQSTTGVCCFVRHVRRLREFWESPASTQAVIQLKLNPPKCRIEGSEDIDAARDNHLRLSILGAMPKLDRHGLITMPKRAAEKKSKMPQKEHGLIYLSPQGKPGKPGDRLRVSIFPGNLGKPLDRLQVSIFPGASAFLGAQHPIQEVLNLVEKF
jgi:hypothetical protein